MLQLVLELESKIMKNINFSELLLENFSYINCFFFKTLEKGLVKKDLMNFAMTVCKTCLANYSVWHNFTYLCIDFNVSEVEWT